MADHGWGTVWNEQSGSGVISGLAGGGTMFCCNSCGACESCGGGCAGSCLCGGDFSTCDTSCTPIAGSCAENLCTASLCCLDCTIAACCAPIDANCQANSGQADGAPLDCVDGCCKPDCQKTPDDSKGAGSAASHGNAGGSPMGSGGGGAGAPKPTQPTQAQNPSQLTAAIARFGTSIANAIGSTISRSQALLGNNAKAKQVTTTASNGDLMILVIVIIIIIGGLFLNKSSEGE